MNMFSTKLQIGLIGAALVTNAAFALNPPADKTVAAPPASGASLAADKAAATDPMLEAMREELLREQETLVLPGMQRPYFIEYRMDELHSYEALANYGALTREEENHQRYVRVTVRIGDYAADSSSSRGDGSIQLAPEDNDPAALRYALWTATDEAYKNALRAYAAKQANLKRFEKPPTEKDFSVATPVTHLEPLVALELDRPEWTRRIVDASGVALKDPSAKDVQYSTANVRGLAVNRYLVNTEGSVLRHGYSGYEASVSVGGQAADGMRLSRDNGTTGKTAKELESAAAFHQRAVDDVRSFAELRDAPLADAEDYHGPVLFSGDAAADVLNRLFVPNVEADRPEVGTTARTQGIYTSSYKARVLPEILSAVDDPSVATFKGRALVGAYAVDDEGVPAQAVTVAERGKLENYLIGRTPVRDFPASNGHGRAAPGQAAHSRAGVMIFKAANPLPNAELHAKLVAMAKEQGRDVYEVETMGGELTPRLLYKVHPDGTRQLVRGAVFDELDNRSLRSDIVAAGDDAYIANTLGAVPETTIAPSLLFGDIEVKRATEEQQKLPYYAPPDAK
ncbi:Predicted Zn-dependent protease or its inactivated homolog [Granulicella rosea]|uniref:Predicted Zn-dependent protease or its inactivated homolog n=1 Tax=Granulicella rosea TaxID=474952 RepID=A0A239D767_9BACT|nr:metallopeptidase TldD-related protein [Granulicella rosea]SNS27714.1 Predicted Zn-dependent protease or its inactivated homolog [Granulicella rosea]